MKNFRSIVLCVLGCVSASAFAVEAIPADKVQEKARTCAACHADDGNASTAAQGQYPRLAGQYHDYLARALHEYKSGERKNAVMAAYANALSEAEIQALSSYYAALPGKLDDLAHYEQGD